MQYLITIFDNSVILSVTLNSIVVYLYQNICFIVLISYYQCKILLSLFVLQQIKFLSKHSINPQHVTSPDIRECNKNLKEEGKNLNNLRLIAV